MGVLILLTEKRILMVHEFVCDVCPATICDADTKIIHKCPKCGRDMRWNMKVAIHGNYQHPVHSDSLAINPCQRAEHERLFPNIRLDKQDRPIFDNFVNHENYLKKTGFRKLTQRSKKLGRKQIYP